MRDFYYDMDFLDVFMASFVGFLLVMLIATAVGVFQIVCWWKLFDMAGEDGWKALIPVYSTYIKFKLTWQTKYFFLYAGILALWLIITTIIGNQMTKYTYSYLYGYGFAAAGGLGILKLLSFVVVLGIVLLTAVSCIKVAQAYGKTALFGAGIFFIQPVFLGILAFGDTEYVKSQPDYQEESMMEAAFYLKERWDKL